MKKGGSLAIAAIIAAATVGEGVFALPYVFHEAGWAVGLAYLAVLASAVAFVHTVYMRTLEKVGEKDRLLGLARRYLGGTGFWTGFTAIILGFVLALVAYLVIGARFVGLAFPSISPAAAFAVFWALISVTAIASDRHVVNLEVAGITCTAAIIAIIFFSAWPAVAFGGVPAFVAGNLFLPFGAILFSLAGWTGVEPAYESMRRFVGGSDPERGAWHPLAVGSFIAAALYAMFAAGILGSAPVVTPDTVSGLAARPFWKREVLAALGFIAIGTSYLPISREITNALQKDLGWNRSAVGALVVFLPPVLVLAGLNDFLSVIGLVGGVFIGTQYVLIVSIGRRALAPRPAEKFFLDIVAAAFVAAAVYEVWSFIVH